MHQIVGIDLNNRHFPSSNYKEGEVQITKGCQTYGEAASTISIDQNISQLFELFFKGFTNPLWLPYLNNDNLTLPYEFNFENGCNDVRSIEIFNIFIYPCILPAEFSGGRQNQSTFEYYQPNMMARQLGCGQVPPRLFLHEFLKPIEEIKENMQARRVFEYQCSPTVYTWPFVLTSITHPSFISWWQELHDHIFNEPVHSFCVELMPDFQPTSEVMHLFFFFSQACPSLLIMILCHFLQNTVPAPRARTISYNVAGPISALGFKSTTLAQLMSRYATSDPTLISSASDKRKAPSLVVPPAAKKKRTSKRVLIEVNIFPFLSIKPLFLLIISSCIISD
jgi:hypothetical protein